MLWLALVLFSALAIALLRGGRFGNLADIRLRLWWLLPLGFAMQAIAEYLPPGEWSRTIGVALVLASFLPLIILVIANRERTGMWLAGLGVLMNFSVILINGGMPVLGEAVEVAAGFRPGAALPDSIRHIPMTASTRLTFLADVIPIPFFGRGSVISLGDVFLAVGLGQFLETELRRPVRWFRRGTRVEGGSATR